MTYETAKELKDKGFPQTFASGCYYVNPYYGPDLNYKLTYKSMPDTEYQMRTMTLWEFDELDERYISVPTLDELISECGDDFMAVCKDRYSGTYLHGLWDGGTEDVVWVALSWSHEYSTVFGSDLVAPGDDFWQYPYGVGKTPEEAVASFWLSLNKQHEPRTIS